MDAKDTSDPVAAEGASDSCYAKTCELPATTACDRCGRRFCAQHCGVLVLQRRDEPSEYPTHQGMLARLPMHTESYILCAPCRNKPVPRTLPLTAQPSLPPTSAPKPSVRDAANRWADAWSTDDH